MTAKKPHGNIGNVNASRGVPRESRLNIGCVSADKGVWVAAANADPQCKNLTDWVNKALNEKAKGKWVMGNG